MPADIAERVLRVVAQTQHLPPEKVRLDSTFEELGLDSLDGINILFALENEFNVNIPDDAARSVRSMADLVTGTERLLGEDGAKPVGAP